jgi:archaellum component FlaC
MLEEECKRSREMVDDLRKEIAELKEILQSRSNDISNR